MMNWYDNLTTLEIDVSSFCNAACPSCRRTQHREDLSLMHFDLNVWKRLWLFDLKNITIKKLVLNGNWGDPMMHKDFVEMLKYPIMHNPDIQISIDSNGGYRTEKFWSNLAEVLNDYNRPVIVRFGIDGTTNYSNNIYRVDVLYDTVIRNARAFINAGGFAQWNMTVFDHNYHQVRDALHLAADYNFISFRSRKSYSRKIFDKDDNVRATTYCYENKNHKIKKLVYNNFDDIESRLNFNEDIFTMIRLPQADRELKNVKLYIEPLLLDHKCVWFRERRLQIDPYMNVWPCCHISGELMDNDSNKEHFKLDIFEDSWKKYEYKCNNLKHNSFKDVIQHNYFTKEIDDAVNSARWKPCVTFCGVDK